MAQFTKGTFLKTKCGEPVKVISYIAGGGQGDVYLVEYRKQKKALKWYKNVGNDPKSFYKNLKQNIQEGAPAPCFLWPEALVTTETDRGFGYIMDLRPAEFQELSKFILAANGAVFPSFKAAVEACLKIVAAFRILHNKGYSYQDINDGNFFINPRTAEVLICDNDNVAPDGFNTGVIGKPRYMAPEIVVGKGNVLPNKGSDRFSLAIILFILLCNDHPLEGKRCVELPCMTLKNAEKLYGSDAVFIYDDNDASNRPVKNIHRNVIERWEYMPTYMKDAFKQAFSKEAMHCPEKRLRELDWLKVLTRFRSEIIKCECGNEIFIEDINKIVCEACGKRTQVSNVFELPEYSIPATKGTWIYRCQLGMCSATTALDPIIHVVTKNGVWAWQNMSGDTIKVTTASGVDKIVRPQEVAPIKSGMVIYPFNNNVKININ